MKKQTHIENNLKMKTITTKEEVKKYVEEYHKEKSGFSGQLSGFPIKVVTEMVWNQVQQGNRASIDVFERDVMTSHFEGGFIWRLSKEGFYFFRKVILGKRFDLIEDVKTI